MTKKGERSMINGKRAKKIERDLKYKNKLKRLVVETNGWSAEYCEPNNLFYEIHKPIQKPYYKRLYYGKHSGRLGYKGFYKRYANHIIRRTYKETAMKGGDFKRVFDLWWTLY